MKRQMTVLFFTVFIDLVGFGIVIPLHTYLARHFGASPAEIGWLMASYSLLQFIFAPVWGRLSDRVGRKPIILLGLCGSAVSYVMFAFGQSYEVLLLSRAFAGICGAPISVAMASMADITGAQERSKGMGLIGAAFGLGFVLGPAIGGLGADIGFQWGEQPPFGIGFPALIAALICFLNLILAFFSFNETLPLRKQSSPVALSAWQRLQQIVKLSSEPVVGPLLGIYFLASLGLSFMEVSLFMWVQDRFQLSLSTASLGFAYVGLVMALTQGGLIRSLLPRFGERRLQLLGLCLSTVGIASLPWATPWWTLIFPVSLLGLGTGLANPSMTGSISLLAAATVQGGVFGVTQSLSALGRILGPSLGAWSYGSLSSAAPFYLGGGMMAAAAVWTWRCFSKLPENAKSSSPTNPQSQDKRVNTGIHANGARESSRVESEEFNSIGLFQFENLANNQIPFIILDLRTEVVATSSSLLNTCLAQAPKVDLKDLLKLVEQESWKKDQPLIAMTDGKSEGLSVIRQLNDLGYINTLWIDLES